MNRLKDKLARLHGKKQPDSAAIIEQDSSSVSSLTNTEQQKLANQASPYGQEQCLEAESAHVHATISLSTDHVSYMFDDPYIDTFRANQIGLYSNEYGSFLFKRTRYSLEHKHGMYTLGQLAEVAPFLSRFNEGSTILSQADLLFFDLETTGLGTGTGNIPFMVGLAYFEDDCCVVEQAVIRHVAEERALLAYLHHLTSRFTQLVTYNGKTFDWPLIVNRYIMNGMREEIWQPQHIDLLHPSRFLWRNTLESCKLSYIEEARLGITRIDDLPGSEAPDRYFKYLADFNPVHLLPVYEHNELDMLTLVSLLTRFGYLLTDQDVTSIIQLPTEPEEMIRTGLWLEKMGLSRQCELLFEVAITLPPSYAPTLYALSMRDKQQGNIERALFLWKKIIDSEALELKSKLDCTIQLAIYYEHKQKNFSKAIDCTEEALRYHIQLARGDKRDKAFNSREQELTKRLSRLQAKQVKAKK